MEKLHDVNITKKTNNYYSIKNGKRIIRFQISKVLCPFGLDEEYGNYILKIELNPENHKEILKEIREFDELIKDKFNCVDEEWKELIHVRDNGNLFLEAKVRKIRTKHLLDVEYEDKQNNYLKTMYEIDKNKIMDVSLEISTLWDFRKENQNNNNKIGLLLHITKMYIY
jgi:hypothetical protein